MSFTTIISVTLFISFAAAHRGPPPEAIEACASLIDGDNCSFETPRGQLEGTCWRPDDSKPLACRPENAPPPGEGRSSH